MHDQPVILRAVPRPGGRLAVIGLARGSAEVRATARRLLPGVRYRRHLLWRYSLLWRKPRG